MALSKAALAVVKRAMNAGDSVLARKVARGDVPWEAAEANLSRRSRIGTSSGELRDDLFGRNISGADVELDTVLLRRWQQGKTTPSWFRPWDKRFPGHSPSLGEPQHVLKYDAAKASTGQMGKPTEFARNPGRKFLVSKGSPDAAIQNRAVRKNVSASDLTEDRFAKISQAQQICGVNSNPRVCRRVSEMLEQQIPEMKMQLGTWKGRQHAWNVLPDGTIVDATAAQFGLPSINVVPSKAAKSQGYRPFNNKKLNKFLDDYRNLTQGGTPDDMDLMLGKEMGYNAMSVLRATGIF